MFRHRKSYNQCFTPIAGVITERRFVNSVDEDGNNCVHLVDYAIHDDSDIQLDPLLVSVEQLLESGVKINPGSVQDLLSDTGFDRLNKFSQEHLAQKFDFVREYLENNKEV